jgi:hypothetical protein
MPSPDAAFILVDDADLHYSPSPIQTVQKQFEGFTKKQLQVAAPTCHLMGMIGAPFEREFQGLVCMNLLKDCPITNNDIINAHKIFSPDLTNISGKTACWQPDHGHTEIVDIPQKILDNQKNVTLTTNVMFVNGVTSLVSSSRNINLTTIEHFPSHTADKLGFLLHRIINVYACMGFKVQMILMDNKFEKVRDHV